MFTATTRLRLHPSGGSRAPAEQHPTGDTFPVSSPTEGDTLPAPMHAEQYPGDMFSCGTNASTERHHPGDISPLRAKTTYRTAPSGNALPYGTNATAESHLHETFSLAMSMAPAERQLLGGTSPKQKPSALCKAKGLTSGSLPNAPFQRRVMPLVSHPCGAWQRQHHPYGASRCHWHHALRCVALLTPRLAACCDAIRHHVLRSDVFGSLPLRDWR